MMMEIVVQCRN